MTKHKGICIITFSNNYDHQEVAFSMFNELYPKYNVYLIGLSNPKNPRAPHNENTFYYNAPKRPGITKESFNIKVLMHIVKKINSLDVEYIYFESEHLWNALVMLLIKKRYKIVEVIHDVIPHSDSKGKNLANKITCCLSDYVLIRNEKYKNDLIKRYKVEEQKIITIPLWRYYPAYYESKNASGFLFFGRIRKYKGIDQIIEITKKCPNIAFNIGSSDEECKEKVEELKKLVNVNVVDREVTDAEMEKYFKETKAILLPYESATQSGVIVDAYKYSKPVIAYNTGAIIEQIDNEKSGFLIEYGNTNEFIEKIKLIDSMPNQEFKKFQKQAYNFGYKKYSSQVRSKDFINKFLND